MPNHVLSTDPADYPGRGARRTPSCCAGRSMLVRTDRAAADRVRGARLPVRLGLEGLRRRPASVCGIALPAGLRESDRLPEPIFTPATKAQSGHDINISEDEAAALVGRARARARRAT